jgi:hypothetical protein
LQSDADDAYAALENTKRSIRNAESQQLPKAQLLASADEADAHARAVRTAGDAARDRAALTASVRKAGERAGVRVHRIEPSAPSNADDLPAAVVQATRLTVDAEGPYPAVLLFIESLTEDCGLARIERVRLTPAPTDAESDALRVTVETTHFDFDVPEPAPEPDAASSDGGLVADASTPSADAEVGP